jgi:tetratricopeptide (TPR) repeat protein
VTLPKWFREGIAVYLCDQGRDKLLNPLPQFWADTDTLLSGFAGDHQEFKYVTGYYFFAELQARTGREGLLGFVQKVIAGQSLDQALAKLPVSEAELWDGARERAAADISGLTAEVGPLFKECMLLYEQGKKSRIETMACLKTLMDEYAGTYAADCAHYWYGKCAFHKGQHDLAREYFDSFLSFDQRFGLLAKVWQLRFLMDTRDSLEQYLALFPEDEAPAKLRDIHDVLRGKLKGEKNAAED